MSDSNKALVIEVLQTVFVKRDTRYYVHTAFDNSYSAQSVDPKRTLNLFRPICSGTSSQSSAMKWAW